MHFVYIIKSEKDGSFYTGITKKLEERIKQHNSGESKHTKGKIPWKLIWSGVFFNKSKARKFEKYLKTASGIAFRNKHFV